MKKADITIGKTYTAKVSDKVVPVLIEREHPSGGWDATNTVTGKTVRIKSAQRLRAACEDGEAEAPQKATGGRTTPRGASGKKGATGAAKGAQRPTQANERAHGDVPDKGDAEPRKPKPTTPGTPATPAKNTKLSLLDAAATVLTKAREPMACKAIVEGAMALGWTTSGKTPHATLYAAMTREIATKGDDARFVKVDRGRFTIAGARG